MALNTRRGCRKHLLYRSDDRGLFLMTDGLEYGAKSMEESNRLEVILYVYNFGAKKDTGEGPAAMMALGLDTHTPL